MLSSHYDLGYMNLGTPLGQLVKSDQLIQSLTKSACPRLNLENFN